MNKVSFAYINTSFSFSSKKNLKLHIDSIFKNEGTSLDKVQYIFCTDDYLLEINNQFLQHNTLTDIITFELQNANEPVIGEIYVSIERVKENAKLFNTTFSLELLRVVSHGALHLCGYKDKNKAQKTEMRGKEDFYINLFTQQQTN